MEPAGMKYGDHLGTTLSDMIPGQDAADTNSALWWA